VIIFDQPTRGLDLGAIEHIHRTILAEKVKGKAIVLISTELSEIFGLSDRIAVIYRGEIVGIYRNHDLDTQQIGLLMAGYTTDRKCGKTLRTANSEIFWSRTFWLFWGLTVSGLLLLFLGENPLTAMGTLFGSLFRDSYTFADVFVKATPLMFTALAFAFTFQANLFNIGAQGQFYIGAITAVGCSLFLQDKLPGALVLVIAAVLTILTRRAVGRDDWLVEGEV
jgi:energy-coupling factor transporter ATP-binding protein EcfA2